MEVYMSFKWCLKEKMAENGIWKCTDLTKLLKAYGFNISPSMVSRIVEKKPDRINTEMLDALCDILKCSLADIMVHTPSSITIDNLIKASGDNIGIKPGPKPKKSKTSQETPSSVLGPRGGVI
jgi:DNA-binding Xre family transcriptional regulator